LDDEIYDYAKRLERHRRQIANLRNGELALRLLDHLASLGLSQPALSNYASHLIAVLRLIDFDVAKATRGDVERVVAAINGNKRWKESTKHHKRVVLRKLIQYAKYGSCERETPLPPEVSWIKLRRGDKDSSVTPEALLTMEEFEALVKAADNQRDRAMLYVMFEGALRPGELLSMNVRSVEFKSDYCVITVNGKTGLKRLPLVVSYRPLLEWVRNHPKATEPNAPLWCSLAPNRKGDRLSYRHFRLIIKRVALKAGLKKTVWPYLFRHTTLTNLAKVFTEARLEKFAGWVHGSRMAARYVHFSARDLEDAILELHGLKNGGKGVDLLRMAECPRCSGKNPPGEVRCQHCGYILDRDLAIKVAMEEKEREQQIIQRIERLESMVKALINGSSRRASSTPQAPEECARDQPS